MDLGFNFLGNVLNVKWKHYTVFRRFALTYEHNKIYEALMKKCIELVPSNDYELAWFDEEGDPIRINSEADLLIAIQSMDAQLLRVHSIKKEEVNVPKPPSEGSCHPGVQCDLCDAFIIGTRFKCVLCADYDLCGKCESTGEHKHHAMLRIVDPNETIVPWGGRLRARPGFGGCPAGEWRRRRGQGPFHHAGLFQQANMEGAKKKMEETRDEFLKHMESEEWKKTCKGGLDFLNNVGQQIQQALANFGIDSTIESMEVRPGEPEKKDEKKEEGQQDVPMEQALQKGSDVELLEPTRPVPQEPVVQPSAPQQQQQPPLQSIPLPQAIPMPAPQPIPYAVPMPPPMSHGPFPPHPLWMNHPGFPGHPILPFGAPPKPMHPAPQAEPVQPPQAPLAQAQQSQPVPTQQPPVVEAREVGDWVFGEVYPQLQRRAQLTNEQQKILQQLALLGFPNNVRAEDAARRFPNDINGAIDYLQNLKLD